MANAPCARLTKPIRPIVTDRPTETMNSTVPADNPPNRIPARLLTISTGGFCGVPRLEHDAFRPVHSIRHCERSEAIQGRVHRLLDCFVRSLSSGRPLPGGPGGPSQWRLATRPSNYGFGLHGPNCSALHSSLTFGIVSSTFSCNLPSVPLTTSSRYSFMTMSRVCGSIMIGPCGLTNFQPSSDFTAASPSILPLVACTACTIAAMPSQPPAERKSGVESAPYSFL